MHVVAASKSKERKNGLYPMGFKVGIGLSLGYDGLPIQPVALPSPDYILGPKEPQTLPVPQDKDEREPMNEHVFPVEEPPITRPIDSPTAETAGTSMMRDEDEEDEDEEEEEHSAPADFAVIVPTIELVSPLEGTEPVIPPPSTDITTTRARIIVRLQDSISLPPEAEVERLLPMPTRPPSLPISLLPPFAGECLVRCTAPSAHSSPPPCPQPLLNHHA
ncbi:hypothetical protein Tco_1256817 [Tanacetum coccineum]